MGEREQFLNQSQDYNANAIFNFLSDANANNHISMNNFNMSFQTNSKNLIFNVFEMAKTNS
jgi:hypothetical protein